MIPFILHHMISNLDEEILEEMTNYWLKTDEVMVEEMILAGSDYGWEVATSKGWIRAFKIMIQKGL